MARPRSRHADDPVVRRLLALAGVFALVATVVVVIGDDARVLRLGVLAGLWATLVAAAAVARRGARPAEAEVAEREEALRRAHELDRAAAEAVRREAGDEIAGLRAELERLRAHAERSEAAAGPPRLQAVAGGWTPAARPTPSWGPDGPAAGTPAHALAAESERRRLR